MTKIVTADFYREPFLEYIKIFFNSLELPFSFCKSLINRRVLYFLWYLQDAKGFCRGMYDFGLTPDGVYSENLREDIYATYKKEKEVKIYGEVNRDYYNFMRSLSLEFYKGDRWLVDALEVVSTAVFLMRESGLTLPEVFRWFLRHKPLLRNKLLFIATIKKLGLIGLQNSTQGVNKQKVSRETDWLEQVSQKTEDFIREEGDNNE